MPSGVKNITNQHIFQHLTLTPMTDLMTQCTHQKPHFPQITIVFKRFAMERMATRGFGAKKIAAALGVPEVTTKR